MGWGVLGDFGGFYGVVVGCWVGVGCTWSRERIVDPENIVKFSLWSQKWNYSDTVKSDVAEVLDDLMEYYSTSSSTFKLIDKSNSTFTFSRGWKWVSACGFGSEKSCYHIIEIELQENDGLTKIRWDIDLKLFGVQAANNALIKECEEFITKKNLG